MAPDNQDDMREECLLARPIGHIRTTMRLKFESPSQPRPHADERNVVELLPHRSFEDALRDIEGFERIWLVWWFHKNTTWRPVVLPPRGGNRKRGVFATRSPHRPNPIGVSAVTLHGVKGRFLEVGSVDLLDGTPILDIKPYIATVDSFPDSRLGWLAQVEAQHAEPPPFQVTIGEPAKAQTDWLKTNWSIDFVTRAAELLARDPSPHRTRRIVRARDGFRMGCGAWRVYFEVDGAEVVIRRIASGYSERALFSAGYDRVPDRDAQIAFLSIWPEE